MTEIRSYSHMAAPIPEPYSTWVRLRAVDAIRKFSTRSPAVELVEANHFVLASPMGFEEYQQRFKGHSEQEQLSFHGTIVSQLGVENKTTLYPRIPSSKTDGPLYYNSGLANKFEEATLPGFSCFSKQEVREAFSRLSQQGHRVRAILPDQSDMAGQLVVDNFEQIPAEYIASLNTNGLVLIANLAEVTTAISVAQERIGQTDFSYLATQRTINHQGRDKYAGSDIFNFQTGIMLDLITGQPSHVQRAILQADQIRTQMEHSGDFICGRFVVDILQGIDERGNRSEGGTDLSFRASGTTPSISRLSRNGYSQGFTRLIYPRQFEFTIEESELIRQQSAETGIDIAVDNPSLFIITAVGDEQELEHRRQVADQIQSMYLDGR